MELGHDFEVLANNLHEGLYLVNRDREITFWNRAAERITGFAADEVMGKRCSDNLLIHINAKGKGLCTHRCPLHASMCDGKTREVTIYLHHKNGHRIPVNVRASVITDEDGKITGAVEVFSDTQTANELHSRLEQLEALALVDQVTKLPNRRFLESRINAQLGVFERESMPFGLLFMDIDHFKHFNDTYGHDVGDQALQTVARTLDGSSRPFDVIGRWGGEEFVGILGNCDLVQTREIAERLCILVRESMVNSAAGPLRVTVSIGGTVVAQGDTADSIVRRADHMMYLQKQAGRNGVHVE
jgi:diguanylate cyclase (GGDEF)-like protein/PAS domain S-box-containing protein